MPNSLLFAINNEGRVYFLSTGSSMWKEFMYLGLEFKHLSAIPNFLWAVGGDRQVYVHVHGLEIPIRVKEEAYENERWLPVEGFSGRLLPTDRYHFSTKDGTQDRAIDRIRLPSMAWQWEGDWQLELSLDGQPLDHDGWSYAVDFPAQFGPTKQWKSCVRRRKWVRYRRYSALNSWCAIAPLHKDPTQEPFINVSIGGHKMPNGPPGSLSVWAITAHGRVMFRSGTSTTAPEGLRWTNISVPPRCEVKQVSVGPTALVWVLLWTGRALVRKGVTRDCPMGESWLEVKAPDETKLNVVSVGQDSVWSLSSDGRVWFRKGINGTGAGNDESNAIGKGWLEIGGNMSHVSVTANDQVFAVGANDRCIYWRYGVNTAELSGKNWRLIQASLHLSRTSSVASLMRGSPRGRHRSLNSLNRPLSTSESAPASGSWEESHSAPAPRTLPLKPPLATSSTPTSDSDDNCSIKSNSQSINDSCDSFNLQQYRSNYETTLKNPRAWSPVRSVGSVVGMEAHPEADSSVFDNTDSGMYGDDESDHAALYWNECDAVWTLVESGGCIIDPTQIPHWFADTHTTPQVELTQPWRIRILDDLKARLENVDIDLSSYEKAIDSKSWVKTGEARCLTRNNASAEDCILSLECHSGSSGGTLTILNTDGATTKYSLILSEITCVVGCSEAGFPRLAVYAPARFQHPIKLQFASDTDQEEWLSILVDVTCQVQGLSGRPSAESLWGTTASGDVLAWDPQSCKFDRQENGLYIQELDVFGKDTSNESFESELYNNFSSCSELEVSGYIHENIDRFSLNLQGHTHIKQKHKTQKEMKDVALHINPRFAEGAVIRNTQKEGDWGVEERGGVFNLQPGQDFNIKIISTHKGYDIWTNGTHLTTYEHRIQPEGVASLRISGPIKLFRIVYKSPNPIMGPKEIVWRIMGGHLRRVETCSQGIVWGISYDHTPWVYTGGWGGPILKGIDKGKEGINQMTDTQNYFVYENQRWNPLTGYTGSGLPTDRYMWSDSTGKQKRTRELTKLINRHWHWISDWIVDFHTPGGVDRDGWQYATDFPSVYHGKKIFTDCVRRRRWFRRAQLNTSGPWQELGNTKILDLSLWSSSESPSRAVSIWAVASSGDALFRVGVTKETPAGSSWEHVACIQPLSSISAGPGGVWAVGRKGEAYWRMGISVENPIGTLWHVVEAIPGMISLKQISVGIHIWCIDSLGRIVVRKGVTEAVSEGSQWVILSNDDSPDRSGGFRHVSAGEQEVWSITTGGAVCRRAGISGTSTMGCGWQLGITAMWLHLSSRGLKQFQF